VFFSHSGVRQPLVKSERGFFFRWWGILLFLFLPRSCEILNRNRKKKDSRGREMKRDWASRGLIHTDTFGWWVGVGMNNVELIFLLLLLPVIDPLLLCECRGGFFFFFIYFYFWNFSVASSFIPFPK
jgi:hypothetical protein